MMELRDFNGEKINSKKTGITDITSYIATFEPSSKKFKGKQIVINALSRKKKHALSK